MKSVGVSSSTLAFIAATFCGIFAARSWCSVGSCDNETCTARSHPVTTDRSATWPISCLQRGDLRIVAFQACSSCTKVELPCTHFFDIEQAASSRVRGHTTRSRRNDVPGAFRDLIRLMITGNHGIVLLAKLAARGTYHALPAFSIQAVYDAFGKVGDCQKLELTEPSSSL
eukprot:COSAG02_NODE_8441_length_2569_cov_1.976923_3_plen_171_part_00